MAKRSCVKLDIYRKFSNALAGTVIASVAWIGYEAFLKLKHETKVEHIFVLGNSGEQFEITLVLSNQTGARSVGLVPSFVKPAYVPHCEAVYCYTVLLSRDLIPVLTDCK
ncbi:hypothetical protein LOK49_LG01G03710 [Camellia lanceoleosa]|uniref:Uncharacterized protein n=1 Tax=Camellia lanceoleosa TaxID=1840588 RepID=A0ACC0IX74_9ERIC|nr:hypothetical protein LOK49_LG01G03710 [Camellia lanceoleosa]